MASEWNIHNHARKHNNNYSQVTVASDALNAKTVSHVQLPRRLPESPRGTMIVQKIRHIIGTGIRSAYIAVIRTIVVKTWCTDNFFTWPVRRTFGASVIEHTCVWFFKTTNSTRYTPSSRRLAFFFRFHRQRIS